MSARVTAAVTGTGRYVPDDRLDNFQLFELGTIRDDFDVDRARFLAARSAPQLRDAAAELPKTIPPSQPESVVSALKRLSETYPMLDQTDLFTDASALMAAHVLHGRSAESVIEEMEAVFQRAYSRYRTRQAGTGG